MGDTFDTAEPICLGNDAMKHLMHYVRQVHQRRMIGFYLLPHGNNEIPSARSQRSTARALTTDDRARSIRELYSDAEYENENDDENA
jgi:hypothetical protein